MQVLVFGAGAMGSFFGGMLSARHDVLLVGRSEHVDAVRLHGLTIRGKTVRLARPRAATRVPGGAKPDLILIATKAYDTAAAMVALRRFTGTALFLTLQNGLDNPEVIARKASRVVAGTTAHGVTFVRPGEIRHAGVGDTVIGSWRGVSSKDVVLVRDMLEEAGVPTRIAADIRSELWSKLIVNAAINPIAALTGLPNGGLARDRALLRLLQDVGRETAAVAAAAGVQVDADEAVRRIALVARRTAANRASMLQDLDRGRRTEVDAITGAILRTVEGLGRDAPLNRALHALVKAREAALSGGG